jgi:hypothetical protein
MTSDMALLQSDSSDNLRDQNPRVSDEEFFSRFQEPNYDDDDFGTYVYNLPSKIYQSKKEHRIDTTSARYQKHDPYLMREREKENDDMENQWLGYAIPIPDEIIINDDRFDDWYHTDARELSDSSLAYFQSYISDWYHTDEVAPLVSNSSAGHMLPNALHALIVGYVCYR